MSNPPRQQRPQQSDAQTPTRNDVTPPYTGHQDHSFTLQIVVGLEKTVALNTAAINQLEKVISEQATLIKCIHDLKTSSEITKMAIDHIKVDMSRIEQSQKDTKTEVDKLSKYMHTIGIGAIVLFALIQGAIGLWIKSGQTSQPPVQQTATQAVQSPPTQQPATTH